MVPCNTGTRLSRSWNTPCENLSSLLLVVCDAARVRTEQMQSLQPLTPSGDGKRARQHLMWNQVHLGEGPHAVKWPLHGADGCQVRYRVLPTFI